MLTNRIHLNFREIGPEQALTIVERSQFCNNLSLSLANTSNPVEVGELGLWWILTSGQNYYCIVVQRAWLRDDDPNPSQMVLRIIDQNTVTTIGEHELALISADCRRAIETHPHAKEADVAGVLGRFQVVDI